MLFSINFKKSLRKRFPFTVPGRLRLCVHVLFLKPPAQQHPSGQRDSEPPSLGSWAPTPPRATQQEWPPAAGLAGMGGDWTAAPRCPSTAQGPEPAPCFLGADAHRKPERPSRPWGPLSEAAVLFLRPPPSPQGNIPAAWGQELGRGNPVLVRPKRELGFVMGFPVPLALLGLAPARLPLVLPARPGQGLRAQWVCDGPWLFLGQSLQSSGSQPS